MSKGKLITMTLVSVAVAGLYAATDGPTAIGVVFIFGVPLYFGVTRIQRMLERHRAEREGFLRYNEEVRRRAAGS